MQRAAQELAKACQKPESPCVNYEAFARKPVEAMLGLGKEQPERPDAWIPDSPLWVDRVNQAAKLDAEQAAPFAKSPLVVAMDKAEAAQLEGQAAWLELVGSDTPIRPATRGARRPAC